MLLEKITSTVRLFTLTILACCLPIAVTAQITSDGTTATNINAENNQTTIEGGDRAGNNLFHSFTEFSIPSGTEASFNNATDVENIINRVTGGNISNIDGLLSANGGANLFLINPAGIIFGNNASLDIGGSFLGSTADSVLFPDDVEFSAADPENNILLTVNAPIGLNFRDNPGYIAVNGSFLQVPTGETLALIGGNVRITGEESGGIFALGGRVELGSVVEAGEVAINGTQSPAGFKLNSFSFPAALAKGDVELTNFALVNVRGGNGGDITINARNIELSGGEFGPSELDAGIETDSGFSGAQAGNIVLNATDTLKIDRDSGIFNRVLENGIGDGGDILLNTSNLSLIGGSQLSTTTLGEGNAGNIQIEAREITLNNGAKIDSETNFLAQGKAGNIQINTARLTLTNLSDIVANTSSQNDAGNIFIRASDRISADDSAIISQQSTLLGTGNAGKITIDTGNLFLTNGGLILNGSAGLGNGGAITIKAKDTISLTGIGSIRPVEGVLAKQFSSSIASLIDEFGSGDAGAIDIKTKALNLNDRAAIEASNIGQGNGGNIFIVANSLSLDGNTVISAANDPITFESNTQGLTSGNVDLQIEDSLILQNNSQISAFAGNSTNGGNINLDAQFAIAFPNQNNDIIANAQQGLGGNIDISTEAILGLEERSSIPANNTNDIDASSQFGNDGNVSINSLDNIWTQDVIQLPRNIVEQNTFTYGACGNGRGNTNYTIVGKGGVVPAPDLPLNAHNIVINGKINPTSTSTIPQPIETSQGKIQPARGVIVTKSGKIILTAYQTNQTEERLSETKANCGI
jgi:filamentous hemagglutinin family protein